MPAPLADQQSKKIKNNNLEAVLSNPDIDPTLFINTVVRESVFLAASDILFEPRDEYLLLRIRIDGVLYELGRFSMSNYDKISSRIKILCDLDITKKNRTQEGQFTANAETGEINLRVAIVETVYGELIVIRIHEKNTIIMDLEALGFNQKSYEDYNRIINKGGGLVLVCGPTGSGKTTTLYSTISKLNRGQNYNVMTIEDPVEFKVEGLNQMQADEKRNFTFAAGLKTILRLSPDIILVGEIRNSETAKIAIESGLTGQLVFSTIHADDSVGALFRLLDLGIEPYLLNSALIGIVAQRLVRKNCPYCLEHFPPTPEESDIMQTKLGRIPAQLARSKGCSRCQNLGFTGRIGIYETLPHTASIRDLVRKKISEEEMRNTLITEGLTTLLKDGLEKCEHGVTTLQEVFRNNVGSM